MGREPISDAVRELGRRVRARRNELGWSMERLADVSGIHWSMVGQIERGQVNVGMHNLLKVAAGPGIDPSELVSGLRPPPSTGRLDGRCALSSPAGFTVCVGQSSELACGRAPCGSGAQ